MAEVKVLIEGYTSDGSEEEKTCATVSLIKDGDLNIVVDPGVLENQQILIDALNKEGLGVNDIDIVFITHSHLDHYRNIGMFPMAKALEYYGLWEGNICEDWEEQFTDDIRIIKTPGHNYDGLTLLVKTNEGIVAICGDVFWKESLPKDDPYASDKEELEKSRKKVLELADYIIPGHAGMYKNVQS
ncbi:MBL fold metallo-hydrolase [Patescibacteria group bacterium]|nr:MBL fold metallo-hydrolase [Patescibacteria group bacterium]